MSREREDPNRSWRRLEGMATPEIVSLIAATIIVIATLTFLAPDA
jgi:hypothetical protein